MSENLNRDFSRYEAMATEELEEILRLDACAADLMRPERTVTWLTSRVQRARFLSLSARRIMLSSS